ncbi:MAG: hypothetical protein IJU78_08485 [Clostridia bacterium]|nr:hypothetical protein [Clostridia bacterium]
MTNKGSGFLSHMAIGLVAGTVLGAAAIGMTSRQSRRRLMRHANQTMRSMGDIAGDLVNMVKN